MNSKLFYIIGASGVGKDTLINYARRKLVSSEKPVIFLHRYITRPANAGGENHIELSEQEFELRLKNRLFAMNWDSHGNRYGIGIESQMFLNQGFSVVINGSREYLPQATRNFSDLVPVLITVDEHELAERLHGRGRESANEIEQRLQRAKKHNNITHYNLELIDNSDWNDEAGNELVNILKS